MSQSNCLILFMLPKSFNTVGGSWRESKIGAFYHFGWFSERAFQTTLYSMTDLPNITVEIQLLARGFQLR